MGCVVEVHVVFVYHWHLISNSFHCGWKAAEESFGGGMDALPCCLSRWAPSRVVVLLEGRQGDTQCHKADGVRSELSESLACASGVSGAFAWFVWGNFGNRVLVVSGTVYRLLGCVVIIATHNQYSRLLQKAAC